MSKDCCDKCKLIIIDKKWSCKNFGCSCHCYTCDCGRIWSQEQIEFLIYRKCNCGKELPDKI